MTRRPPRASALLMLAAVVVLVACGAGNGPGTGGRDPDTGTSATDAPTTPAALPTLPVRDDLVDPQVVTWRSWRAVDARELEFTVTAGPADCYAAQPEVAETDDEVKVRLLVGRTPESASRECPAIAVESTVPVRLSAPLAGRAVRPLA